MPPIDSRKNYKTTQEMFNDLNKDTNDLIQNALRIKSTGQILISRHGHDYQSNDDNTIAVDGGINYIKWTGAANNPDIEELVLYENDSIQVKAAKMVWGTFGKNGNPRTDKVRYILLCQAQTQHLVNIVKRFSSGLDEDVKHVCHYILMERKDSLKEYKK